MVLHRGSGVYLYATLITKQGVITNVSDPTISPFAELITFFWNIVCMWAILNFWTHNLILCDVFLRHGYMRHTQTYT